MTAVEPRATPGAGRGGPVWFGLLALLALAPIPFGSYRPWAWSALSLLASILLGGWAISAARGRMPLVWRRALLFPLVASILLVLWICLTIIPGVGPANPVWGMASEALGKPLDGTMALSTDAVLISLMRLLAYMSIFWLSLQYCRDPRRAGMLLEWISWTGLILAVYGLVNYFAGNAHILWFERFASLGDVTATFVNRNNYATFAGLGMICSAAVAVTAFRAAWQTSDRSQNSFPRTVECLVGRPLVYSVIATIIGMAWLQSHSRMGTAAVLIGLATMVVLMMAARLIRRRIIPWLLIALALLFLFQVSGRATLERLGTTSEIDRLPIFSIVSDQIASAPLTGSGYGSFPQAFMIYRDQRLSTNAVFLQAHDSYLELAAELGIPAAILLSAIVVWCAGLCFVAVFRRQRGQIFPIVAFAATLTVATHALVDFSLQIPAVAALYASLLGMGVAQSWSSEARIRK